MSNMPVDIKPMEIELIDNEAALDALCKDISHETLLAVDTEFFRETSYFPHIGLVQLASSSRLACVDPLAFDARRGLANLLLNPSITKIFHSCIQDLEVLYQYLGALPCPLIDTQIAAALLSTQEQIGYAGIVEQRTGKILDKSQTRTNWLNRPLSAKQIQYAGDDVLYLIPMYQQMQEELKQLDREHWLEEECDRLCSDTHRFHPDMENCWKRVKGYFNLQGVQLSVCRAIAHWRELQAIQKDITRRRVLADNIVLELSQAPPQNRAELTKITALRKSHDDDIDSLLESIQHGLNVPSDEWPVVNSNRPTAEEKNQLQQLLEIVDNKAKQLELSRSILCPRKDLEALLNGNRNLQVLNGWRLNHLGKELLAQLPA